MSPSIKLRVSPNARDIATPTVSRDAIRIEPHQIETPHEHVAEVIASQGSMVLDVQHVGQVRGRARRATSWLALGGLMFLTGAGVMASEVGQDWEGYREAQHLAATAGLPAPEAPGHGLAGLGIGLALLGLVPLGLGLVRRGDAGLDRYTLGESPDASFPVSADTLPTAEPFGLVQRHGQRYALGITPQMRGEVHWAGRSLDLAGLVAGGHTVATASGHAFLLPDGARCRIEHEGITYRVATVARGKAIAGRGDADKPFWLYNAGSFAVLGTLLALVHLVPEDALAMAVDDLEAENRYVGFVHQPDEPEESTDIVPAEVADADLGSSAPAAAGPAGTAGEPTVRTVRARAGRASSRPNPMLKRTLDMASAPREAGILGIMGSNSGRILASPTVGAFSMTTDDGDLWSGVGDGDAAATRGVGGMTTSGERIGGGGADGVVGFSHDGLIGKQGSGGDRYDRGSTIGHRGRNARAPRVRPAKPDVTGSMDKDAIRRVVRSRINQVRHCYNQGLTRNPNMEGRVAVRFSIGPVGKVVSAVVTDNSLGDAAVGSCISRAVRRWSFPRPPGGGSAVVTYPFAFSVG